MDLETYLRLDATAMAEWVRAGAVTPLDLVELAIQRIERLDGAINAVTWRGFDAARAEAVVMARAAPGDRPFFGVPYLIKDLNAWAGGPSTFGSRLFERQRVRRSEASVAAALATGLIPLGRTNTGEFGLLATTEPLLFGPTRNPFDHARSVGGSSGGSAAAVAAGYAPMAFASDGGGSIRIPASACGVFGFKPSQGRTPWPARRIPGDLGVHFNITRSVRDAARMLAAVELDPPEGAMARTGLVVGPARRRLVIGVRRLSALGRAPDPDAAAALAKVETLCRDLGHTLVEAEPVAAGEEAVRRFLTYWSWVPAAVERNLWLIRLKTGRLTPLEHALEPWSRSLAEWHRRERKAEPDLMRAADAYFDAARARLMDQHRRIDVFLSPVTRTPAPLIGDQAPSTPFDTLLERTADHVGYTPVENAVGAPAMSVPLGETSTGLPIGVQFAAAPGRDRSLLGLAFELEQAAPWESVWAARRSAL